MQPEPFERRSVPDGKVGKALPPTLSAPVLQGQQVFLGSALRRRHLARMYSIGTEVVFFDSW